MIINDNNSLSIEFDGRSVSLDGKNFQCYYFELTNRCNAISNGTIRFFETGNESNDVSLISNGHSYIGAKAVIKYSKLVMSETLFVGYISSVTSSNNGEFTYVDFNLSSPEFWLLSGRNIINLEEPKTYSYILDQIFSKYKSKLGRYKIEFEHDIPSNMVLIHNSEESDYEYVKKIAHQTGSLFYSLNGNVIIRPIEPDLSSYNVKLDGKIGEKIKEIKLTSNIIGIPKNVKISYIKDDDYANPITISKSLSNQIGNGSTPDDLTSNIDESTSLNFINLSIDSDATATYLANSENKRRSLNFVECEILCDIIPELKVGSNITVSNFNSIANNDYILTSLTHKFENTENGPMFTTKLVLNSDSIPLMSGFGLKW